MSENNKHIIVRCFDCGMEITIERGTLEFYCPVCQRTHDSKLLDKYEVSDAAGALLFRADRKLYSGDYDEARELYQKACAADENEPHAYLGAALARFEVEFDDDGEPCDVIKKGIGPISDNDDFKRATLLAQGFREDYYDELGARVDGIISGFEPKEDYHFEYIGTRLHSYTGRDEYLKIPSGVTRIDSLAFCIAKNLKRIYIPETVTYLEINAFGMEPYDIEIAESNPRYAVIGGCIIDKSENKLIYSGRATSIPTDERVSVIGKFAFIRRHDVIRLDVPENIKKLEEGAFDCCSEMTEIAIPASVTEVEQSAFSNCDKLTNIVVDSANQEYYVSGGCLIESKSGTLIRAVVGCDIPNEVKVLGRSAFGDGHTSLTFPASVTDGMSGAFLGGFELCSLSVHEDNPKYYSAGNCIIERGTGRLVRGCENSVIPDDGSVTAIGERAFFCCRGMKRFVVPNGVTRLEKFAFEYCRQMREIVLPDTLTEIGEYAFMFCTELEKITLPPRLQSIGANLFDFCKKLEHVTIPASVKYIGGLSDSCDSLECVEFEDPTGWMADDIAVAADSLVGGNALELVNYCSLKKRSA